MANNPYVNKVQKADGTTIIDITDTTAVASDVASGKYFYLATGEKVQGSASTSTVLVVDTPDSHGGTIREITAQNVVSLQAQKQVTLTSSPQTITPDTGYDGFRSVLVPAGGQTIGLNNTDIPNILNMFYALEHGTAKTGELTLASALPATETLVIDTELSTVHGMFIADESQATLNTSNTPENVLFAIVFNPTSEGGFDYGATRLNMQMNNVASGNGMNKGFLARCTWNVTDGKLYCTASFGGNANYTPFYPGHTYRWVAW